MAGFDLGSIIQQATQLTGDQTQQAQAQADLLKQNQTLSNTQAQNLSDAGNLQAQAQQVQLTGELETQQARVKAANSFGTNVNDVSDIITQLGSQMRTTAQQLVQAQDKVSNIEANSDLINNPLGWLNDLLNGDAARSERDALAQKFDTTQKVAQGLNAQTQATVQTQNAITETLSAASIQASTEATKKLADAKALDAKIQGNAYGANAIQTMREVGAQNFNRGLQVYSQITEDQRWKEGFALRQEQFKAIQEQRARGKQEDQYYVDAATRINAYNASAGLPSVTPQQARATLNQSGKIGDIMRDREASGFQILETGGTAKMFGDQPSEVVQRLERDKPNLPSSFEPAQTILKDSLSLAQQEIGKQLQNPVTGPALKADKKAQASIYDSTVKGYALQAQSNIQSGKGNPYEAVPIPTVLQEQNGLAQSKFGQVVLNSLVASGSTAPAPDMIIATANSAVKNGELSFNEARDGITSFFENAVAIKNATGGFLQLGVPPQQGYKTQIQQFRRGLFSSLTEGSVEFGPIVNDGATSAQLSAASKVLDLTKSTDVTLALTVARSKDLSSQLQKKAQE